MNKILFVSDRFIAFSTRFCPRLTFFEVRRVGTYWDVKLAIFTIFRFEGTVGFVSGVLTGRERLFAMRAIFLFFLFVVLFLMLLLKVDVVHLLADGTAFDVATAIAKMCPYFALGKLFQTVITSLHWLVLHLE